MSGLPNPHAWMKTQQTYSISIVLRQIQIQSARTLINDANFGMLFWVKPVYLKVTIVPTGAKKTYGYKGYKQF